MTSACVAQAADPKSWIRLSTAFEVGHPPESVSIVSTSGILPKGRVERSCFQHLEGPHTLCRSPFHISGIDDVTSTLDDRIINRPSSLLTSAPPPRLPPYYCAGYPETTTAMTTTKQSFTPVDYSEYTLRLASPQQEEGHWKAQFVPWNRGLNYEVSYALRLLRLLRLWLRCVGRRNSSH